MKLIGLHGLPRSGKDTIAYLLCTGFRFDRLSFADPLKQAASYLLNRPLAQCHGNNFDREAVMPEWGFSMRWFLQMLGTECLRDVIRDDFWIHRAAIELDDLILRAVAHDEKVNVVITDVRFQNEAEFVRQRGGVLVNVVRPGVEGSSHVSDQPLSCDITIHNDGSLADLRHKIIVQDALKLKGDLTE